MNEEIWKNILGYEGLYQVSSYGRVRSLDRYDSKNSFWKGRILKLSVNGRGYLDVQLCSNGKVKHHLVHRLVAIAFIPNPDNLPEVNHLDEDKSNNSVENLEWCTAKYNINYGTARIRGRDTAIKNGNWSGLSKEEYRKRYWNEHREHLNEWKREYYQKNRDKICEQKREYGQKNQDKIRDYNHQYYQEHKNEYNERNREYYQKNKDKICEYQKEYRRKRKVGL